MVNRFLWCLGAMGMYECGLAPCARPRMHYAEHMKFYVCALILLATTASAAESATQDEGPLMPLTTPDAQGFPADISPEDKADIVRASQIAKSMAEPMVCANLAAQPTPLPNGDFQYPVVPCVSLNITAPLGVPVPEGSRPAATTPQQPSARPVQAPQIGGGSAIQQPAVATDIDFNTLQMKRLGALDAMQGRPLNMNHASNLGYVQGYTEGQQKRAMPQGGGFGGIRR